MPTYNYTELKLTAESKMLTTIRETINELTPLEQLQALKVPYQRYRNDRFHYDEHSCSGKLLVINNHMYACDVCGEESEM